MPGTAGRVRRATGLDPGAQHPARSRQWASGSPHRRGDRLPAILHVDTGMARLGLDCARIRRVRPMRPTASIRWRAVMSHLACADEPDHPLNQRQRSRFPPRPRQLPAACRRALRPPPGSFSGRVSFRPGAPGRRALRRQSASRPPQSAAPGRASHRQKSCRSAKLTAGESVGYGAAHVMAAPGRVGDRRGRLRRWLAALPEPARLRLSRRHARSLLGRVSMDLVTFDVSAARPGAGAARRDDRAAGRQITASTTRRPMPGRSAMRS